MIVKRMNQDSVVIFLPKYEFNLNFLDNDILEDKFKKLFLSLEDRYEISVSGFYEIRVNEDPYYGTILDIEKDDIPYVDYMENQVEMNIKVVNDSYFIYQVNDIFEIDDEILKISDCYFYHDKYYIILKTEPSKVSYMKLLEHSGLIYGNEAKKIIKNGRKIDLLLCK